LESLAASNRDPDVDVNVPAAVKELSSRMVITSTRAAMLISDAYSRLRVAWDDLTSLHLETSIRCVLGEGKNLRNRRPSVLLPFFLRAFDEHLLRTSVKHVLSKRSRRQITLNGSCAARNLPERFFFEAAAFAYLRRFDTSFIESSFFSFSRTVAIPRTLSLSIVAP
jgi:hypothetical protein